MYKNKKKKELELKQMTSNNTRVYHPRKVTCLTYEGDLTAEGVKQGHGRCTTALGTYEGAWFEDAFDGPGTLKLNNGNVYVGEFKEGAMHGRGKMTWANGNVYEGELRNSRPEGQGRLLTDDGVYVGAMNGGKCEGQGKMTYTDGRDYEGTWRQGHPSGVGVLTLASGVRYSGTFAKGERQGRFVVDKPSGSQYVEVWKGAEGCVSSLKVKHSGKSMWSKLRQSLRPLKDLGVQQQDGGGGAVVVGKCFVDCQDYSMSERKSVDGEDGAVEMTATNPKGPSPPPLYSPREDTVLISHSLPPPPPPPPLGKW